MDLHTHFVSMYNLIACLLLLLQHVFLFAVLFYFPDVRFPDMILNLPLINTNRMVL